MAIKVSFDVTDDFAWRSNGTLLLVLEKLVFLRLSPANPIGQLFETRLNDTTILRRHLCTF